MQRGNKLKARIGKEHTAMLAGIGIFTAAYLTGMVWMTVKGMQKA